MVAMEKTYVCFECRGNGEVVCEEDFLLLGDGAGVAKTVPCALCVGRGLPPSVRVKGGRPGASEMVLELVKP